MVIGRSLQIESRRVSLTPCRKLIQRGGKRRQTETASRCLPGGESGGSAGQVIDNDAKTRAIIGPGMHALALRKMHSPGHNGLSSGLPQARSPSPSNRSCSSYLSSLRLSFALFFCFIFLSSTVFQSLSFPLLYFPNRWLSGLDESLACPLSALHSRQVTTWLICPAALGL